MNKIVEGDVGELMYPGGPCMLGSHIFRYRSFAWKYTVGLMMPASGRS
ncbi:hypothetical protein FuraDRAFT_1268 [Pseudogulbenkiania ferrooxidans 2002]|uniref:Uncharacterized protein n=1 Tax=Pseudogulbenkiania ferrooxidans 2002 TaxID=279714 RepID=B9Z1N3_9NEIS|nr:hypothetical protein FuraDRAFT_1268 [Pseudogulbenkiania ferrooxidans 2002]